MSMVSPEGPVYQAGTLSGNPLAVAAGLAQLRTLRENPGIYSNLEARAAQLAGAFRGVTVNRASDDTNLANVICLRWVDLAPVPRALDSDCSWCKEISVC